MPAKAKARSHPSTSRRSPASSNEAIAQLTADHARVKKMFKQYEELMESRGKTVGQKKKDLALQICHELTVHATIEEEIFYPALRAALKDTDLLAEAEVEHQTAKDLIAQIEGMGDPDEKFDAKVTVLGEYIDHHVKEEQDEIFPKCRKSTMDLNAVGASMAARKEVLTAHSAETIEA